MLNDLLSFGVSSLFGMLAGMGVGGGSLLLLWLTQVALLPQQQARIINLLFYLPAAIISTMFHQKNGALQKRVVIPAAIAGCAAAVIFTWIAKVIDTTLLKKLLGALLIATGVREVFYRPRKAK